MEESDEVKCSMCGGAPAVSMEGDVIPCCNEMSEDMTNFLKELVASLSAA